MADAVIISAGLDTTALDRAINKLVNDVENKLDNAAHQFERNIGRMQIALDSLARNARTRVNDIQQSFTAMGTTFQDFATAMERAARAAAAAGAGSGGSSGGSGGGSGAGAAQDTVKWLKEQIELQKKKIDEQKLFTQELQREVNLLAQQKELLKQQTTPKVTLDQQNARKRMQGIMTMPTNELADAERKLRRLRQLLQQTQGTNLLNESQINRVKNAIQQVTEKVEKLREKSSKPTTMSGILGMPEITLNQISSKMRAISQMRANLPTSSQEFSQLNAEYARLSKLQSEVLGKNAKLIESNNSLGRAFNYIKNRLAFALSIGAVTSFVRQLYEVRGQYELLERSLGVLVNSFQKGSQIFAELNAMAIKSPFTLIELGTAAKQLTAYNFEAGEVVNTTKRLADISAALGVPMERLVYNLGQIRAQTVLTARDARDFANAGLAIVPELAKYYTELEGKVVSTADVFDRMKKKAVSYNDTMAVLNKLTDEGGKFFDFQAKQAGTLKVQLANLNLALNNMLNQIGKSHQSILSLPLRILKSLFESWNSISATIRNTALAFGLLKIAQIAYVSWSQKVSISLAAVDVVGLRVTKTLSAIRNGLVNLMKSPMTWWMLLATVVVSAGMAFYDASEGIKEFNKSLKENAKENAENLEKILESYDNIRGRLSGQIAGNVSKDEATKTWDAIKGEIETASGASDVFISKLMGIEDINKRLSASFEYLETIKSVSSAIEKAGDKDIFIQQDFSAWWNIGLGFDSLRENVQDYSDALRRAGGEMNLFERQMESPSHALEVLKGNLDDTYESLQKFIDKKNWQSNVDAINELFGQVGNKIITQGLEQGWQPEDVMRFQLEWEEYRSKAAKQALETRIQEERQAYMDAEDEKTRISIKSEYERDKAQLAIWKQNNGRGRVLWQQFCKWLDDEHSYEVQRMYSKMTDNGTKAINYSSKEWSDWVYKMANDFAKENKLSQDDTFNNLYRWVQRANLWDIFIKLTISNGEGKGVYDTLTDLDKSMNDAYNRMARLDERIAQLRAKGLRRTKQEEEEYTNAIKERADAEKEYIDAESKGGKSKSENAANKRAAAAANKRAAAARRSQAKAESELQKALSQELQLIDKVQSAYKSLTKAGASRQEALEISTTGFEKSANAINAIFKKWGLEQFDIKKFAGLNNPRELMDMLQKQLDKLVASGKAKPEEIKELELKIRDLRVEANKFDLEAITKGLNNELDKIKEEYELGVELDANPELGSIFADMMGISKEEIMDIPRDFQGVLKRMQQAIDATLGDGKFSLTDNLNKSNFDAWVTEQGNTLEDGFAQALDKIREYVNKVRLDENKKIISDWQNLLEKYAEYETKKAKIQQKAEQEREAARKHGASQEIFDAIDLKELREIEKLNFDEFQKSATWITATGDISNLTDKALQMLIDRLWEYKKAAKNLDPKEIIRLNNALRKLRKEQKKDNPFAAWSIMLDEAKQRMEQYEPDIDELTRKIRNLLKKQAEQHFMLSDEDNKRLSEYVKELERLRKEQNEAGKLTLGDKLSVIQKYSGAIKEIADSIINIANGIGAKKISQAAESLKDVLDVVDKAKSGYELGGKYGAIAGAVLGITEMLIRWFDGNEDINDQIEYSQRQVKKLENQYKDLQHAMEEAYGDAKYGAQQAMIYNKKLQLEQLENQLRLEKSRKSKHKDEDAIISLEGQIIDLKNEIHDAINSIVTDMLGISSVSDAAENVVKSMIEAFKSGEDYMKVFEDSFEDMIDNMIAKTIVSRLIGDFIQGIFDQIKARKVENASGIADSLSYAQSVLQGLYDFANEFGMTDSLQQQINEWEENVKRLQDAYKMAITPTPEDIAELQETVAAGKASIKEGFDAWMAAFGVQFGQNAGEAQLSALQQGITNISETTAEALEAYMNSVSQQVYYQSDILTQIRDILVNFGGDVTIATNAQILFELQQSYQVQMSIQSILQGWSNANGLAVRVELAN